MSSIQERHISRSVILVAGTFILQFISFGLAKSFGVIYTDLLDYFRASRSNTSWIPSIASGLILLGGPFAGILEEKYGCRTIAILGSVLISLGLAASSFVEDIFLLYLTYGLITGTGFSLCYFAANVVVNIYFDKKRVFMVGLSSAGSGIGTTLLPILGSFLLNEFNWQGTLLLLSGVGLQGVYCGLSFGSLRTSIKALEKDITVKSISITSEYDYDNTKTKQAANGNSIWRKTKHILSSKKFLMFKSSCVLVTLGYFTPFIMLPDMVTERGISKSDSALLITTSGIASIISRIVFGILSDFPFFNRLVVNGVSFIILGITTCLCVIIYNKYVFFLYSSLLGSVTGTFGMYISVIVVDILGKEYVGLAFGYLTFLCGISSIIGPPFAGFFYDLTGDYTVTFITCGISFCIGGILSILAAYRGSIQRKYILDRSPISSDSAKASNTTTASDTINLFSGSFILYFASVGIATSFGMIYTELLVYFGALKSETSWVASIGSGLMLSFGPFAGMLEEKYGCRVIAIIGSVLVSVGLAASSFVDNMFLLYLTYGILTGIGFSFCHVAAIVVVNVYFDKKRVLAVGLSSAGSGIGTMVLPIMGSYLLDLYNWQGTLLILSGIGLQGLYCALLFGNLGTSTKESGKDGTEKELSIIPKTEQDEIKQIPVLKGVSLRDKTKHILSSKRFIIFKMSSVFVALGYFVPYVMLPDMVIERGISKTSAALMITISGVASILSRITFGFISDFPFCNRLVVNGMFLIILGVATSVCVVFYNEYLFYMYTSLLGLVTGVFGMYQSVIVVDIVGKEYIGLAFGYLSFLNGIAVVIGPPFAGFLYDLTGEYTISFISCGTFFYVGGILSIIASLRNFSGEKYSFEKEIYL